MEDFVKVTPSAIEFFKQSLSANKDYLGIRVDIVSGGCQGMTYKVDFVTQVNPADVCLQLEGVDIYFAPKCVMFVSGMIIDYQVSPMGGNVTFENPNAKSKCSCGKSFSLSSDGACNSGSCNCSC